MELVGVGLKGEANRQPSTIWILNLRLVLLAFRFWVWGWLGSEFGLVVRAGDHECVCVCVFLCVCVCELFVRVACVYTNANV